MKSKLIVAFMLIAGGSAFAQTRFSIQIGGYGPRYAAPPPMYYGPARPQIPYWQDSYRQDGVGYWGGDPDRQHRRAQWYGFPHHPPGGATKHRGRADMWG